ncbi:MAG: hypothetical protein M0P95_03835 [Sulfuritalea sp.]|jgi:hypothetical protein|nr:hypothetical protein [Sulfuritalea sp.]
MAVALYARVSTACQAANGQSIRDQLHQLHEWTKANQIGAFGNALWERLLSGDSGFAKNYLNLLADEIMADGCAATIKGSYSVLAAAAAMDKIKAGHLKQVPTFIPERCAGDSASRAALAALAADMRGQEAPVTVLRAVSPAPTF